jgi:UDP-N-acetylmuramoyl-tripeptide--D-alanyl-D-alanine ligase
MLERGPFAPALHEGVGEYLGKLGVHCLLAVGEQSQNIAKGARSSGVPTVYHCADLSAAKALLDKVIRPDSTILVKASRGMALETLTAALMELTQQM